MTISIAIFAILVALILAILGSVVFILFWAGVALMFLLPTLFVTTAIATFIWLWGMGTYYILKYFNEKPIPGIHTSLKDGIIDNLGADNEITHQLADLTGQKIEGSGEEKGTEERKKIEEAQKEQGGGKQKQQQQHGGGKENRSAGGGGGGDNKKEGGGMNGHAPDPKKAADVGKQAGGKASDAANGVKDKASGATDAASGVKDKASGATGTVTGVAGGAKGAVGI